ncbi:MAG: AAA family ATPase [Pirellulales bacterium]|nr:AAA family ATPase [Pirellulales bacterium]
MITLIEALSFRCLRYAHVPVRPFNVLVGPNASGKTTFLDVLSFIKDTVSEGPTYAIRSRTDSIYDLFWQREGKSFELAIDVSIPSEVRTALPEPRYDAIHYELKVGIHEGTGETGILGERVQLVNSTTQESEQPSLFPREVLPPAHIYEPGRRLSGKTVIHKVPEKNDNFYSEVLAAKGKGWLPSFKFGMQKSALGNLPDDGTRFPASTWLRSFLIEGVQALVLNSLLIRRPSSPGQPIAFKPDGSNLPWVIHRLQTDAPQKFEQWLEHVRTALPDIRGIKTIEREEDRHRFLVVEYQNDVDVPSWMVSDGTLRFLALTLIAYLEDFEGVFLIEEPENGIHPSAVEPLFQSLSSVYGAQVLIATHSPVILGLVDLDSVLCFGTRDGATDIVRGSDHPALRDWQGEASLGVLFASGILG